MGTLLLGFIIIVFLIFFVRFLSISALKRIKPKSTKTETTIGVAYIFSSILFFIGWMTHTEPFYEPIDPINGECYAPFGEKQLITFLTFYLLFLFAKVLVWRNGISLPPLTLVLAGVFLLIGIALNIVITLQVSLHDTHTLSGKNGNDGTLYLIFAPIISTFIAGKLLFNIINYKANELRVIQYNNKFLRLLNGFLTKQTTRSIWIIIFLFPVILLITFILILFGQEADAMIKVFTETATWRFSQQMHPPIVDEHGHYLCTVAAKGSPALVKPLHIGRRNNQPIIVNRQLKIANAFEAMLQIQHPKLHKKIRKWYDIYGFNLSLKINNEFNSNLTYLLMKPAEWFFLLCLYLFWKCPEKLIAQQYV